MVVLGGESLTMGDVPAALLRHSRQSMRVSIPAGTRLHELERDAVEQAIAKHAGNRTLAARALGISVRTLQRRLKSWSGLALSSSSAGE
jgi:transcriptional regulator with PAS, ATPase and Fis domain